ncbi:YgfZ/GcvT domain-containing protein [Sphingomonas tabacisoli]|uniref:YgfZ/GcvT domain-containing protein n=1 Tax=Sphingomonas tabacisoli TaxID=2249466 RepID=A0ABW4I697_9SPHN
MAGTTLTDRALIRLSGEEVRGFLQGLVTNDVTGALPVWAGLLSPQGKALFDFIVWADEGDVLIDCEGEVAEALTRRLTMYRLRRPITIAPEPDLAVHWSLDGDVLDPRLAALGARWLAPPDEPAEGWHGHRLRLGVAEGRAELGDNATLWLECNAAELSGVSFSKGCYVGQENTARMNWRQKVNRRLVVVETGTNPGEAANAWYPELGLAVARLRVEELDKPLAWGRPIVPEWLKEAVA